MSRDFDTPWHPPPKKDLVIHATDWSISCLISAPNWAGGFFAATYLATYHKIATLLAEMPHIITHRGQNFE